VTNTDNSGNKKIKRHSAYLLNFESLHERQKLKHEARKAQAKLHNLEATQHHTL